MTAIGSMFAGLGGLDLACEWALGGRTAWQLDLVGHDVRRRHFPDALQVVEDVRRVDPRDLPRIDVLCGGFPCQDLSTAGTGAGLEGERSGLYVEVLRFARVLSPDLVVIENVPGLLKYRARLEEDWHRLGYGLTWVRARALDAGHPQIRRRVFVIAERGGRGRGELDADRSGEWTPEGSERPWPTPTATNPNESESHESHAARSAALLAAGSRPVSEPLGLAVRPWPTPTVSDTKAGCSDHDRAARRRQLGDQLGGKRLNPDWVECLMGLPPGWTDTEGPRLHADRAAPPVRGRYPEGWDRSEPWPGFAWEPARTLPDGPPAPGRPARLRLTGNAVCPQQGAHAIDAWQQPAQLSLLVPR